MHEWNYSSGKIFPGWKLQSPYQQGKLVRIPRCPCGSICRPNSTFVEWRVHIYLAGHFQGGYCKTLNVLIYANGYFQDVSGRLNETFSTSSQQDAQEFLEFLLDGLHEDLNPNANRTKLAPLTEQEERKRESLPIQVASRIEWGRYTHQNNSVVVNWLQGQLTSKLRCLTCETTSTTYTPFMYLSLPIPHPRPNAKFTLHDCLQEFVKEETLDGEDAWNCSKCKCARKATKKLIITRMPPILIIHLKRFATRGRWGDKLNTPIEFPLVHLNLTKYVPAPLPPQPGKPNKPEPPETTPPFIYDLYGVVNHFGTLSGGHYTSYVKDNHSGTWNGFDDSKVTGVLEGQIAVCTPTVRSFFCVCDN